LPTLGKGNGGRSGGCTATSRNKIDGDLPQHRWTMRVQQASEPQQIAQPHDTQARRCSILGAKLLIEVADRRRETGVRVPESLDVHPTRCRRLPLSAGTRRTAGVHATRHSYNDEGWEFKVRTVDPSFLILQTGRKFRAARVSGRGMFLCSGKMGSTRVTRDVCAATTT
jgi:hypothetical protein